MGADMAVVLARHLLLEALILCAPMLIAATVVSVTMSLVQTLTGVQEQTLTAVPRLVVVFIVMLALMPWTIHRTVSYTTNLWTDFHKYLGA
jgi:flagellar biosynthesis protein FliQ